MQREKRTVSGRLLEADFFPVFRSGRAMPTRAPKEKQSSAAQAKYNRQQAIKKLIRLVNANFDDGDYLMHPTYAQAQAPKDWDEAQRNIRNYVRRVRDARKRKLREVEQNIEDAEALCRVAPNKYIEQTLSRLVRTAEKLSAPLKYAIAIEEVTYKTGEKKGQTNYHYHLFITGGLPRSTMENLWNKGERVNCDRFRPDTFGPEAAARYISKQCAGKKRIIYSRNLEEPKVKIKDGGVTKRQVEKWCADRVDDAEFWEKRYKGYKFVRAFPRWNEYNANWYLSVVMYKTDDESHIPAWSADVWAG